MALSARLSEAETEPTDVVGLKVTEMVQEAVAASDVPQVLVCVKADAALPVNETLEMVSAPVPVFWSVTDCVPDEEPSLVEAKVRLVGERLIAGTPTPVPVSATVWGEFVALSAKLREALDAPAAVGLKVTEMVQEELAASDDPQVFVCA